MKNFVKQARIQQTKATVKQLGHTALLASRNILASIVFDGQTREFFVNDAAISAKGYIDEIFPTESNILAHYPKEASVRRMLIAAGNSFVTRKAVRLEHIPCPVSLRTLTAAWENAKGLTGWTDEELHQLVNPDYTELTVIEKILHSYANPKEESRMQASLEEATNLLVGLAMPVKIAVDKIIEYKQEAKLAAAEELEKISMESGFVFSQDGKLIRKENEQAAKEAFEALVLKLEKEDAIKEEVEKARQEFVEKERQEEERLRKEAGL